MPLDIILNKPYLLVTLSNSPAGIVPTSSTTLVFGVVVMAYATCDSVAVNDFVLFNQIDAQSVMYGSTVYYLVDESFSFLKEPPPL